MRRVAFFALLVVACHDKPPVHLPPPATVAWEEQWRTAPPLDHARFYDHPDLVVTRPTNGHFEVALMRIFADSMQLLEPWPRKEYKALPLGAYLASRSPDEIGRGDHLVITNLRGEQLYLTKDDITKYEPEIVIGLDGERNLHRIALS